jgi:uncharacterized phage infection (PIP) family protein YhgE
MIEKEVFIKDGKVISADDVYLNPRDATIEALQAQLKTVLDREAETHRRHDAKVEELEAQINTKADFIEATMPQMHDLEVRYKAQAAEIERIGQNVLMWLGTYRDDLSQKAIANLQSIARAALGETK